MAKAVKKKVTKPREEHYQPKVTFNGTFEQMIVISTTRVGAKKKAEKKETKKQK